MSAPPPAPGSKIEVVEWSLPGSDGELILGNTHRPPDGVKPVARIVLCHGFKGYMDYGFLPRLADGCARMGIEALRFNFSHSGVTREHDTFARTDLFERDTWNRQVFDLTQVVQHAKRGPGLPLFVFGHSRGGVTALLTAARLAERTRIRGVITAASPADASRLSPEQADQLRQEGRIASPSGRTGQLLYVGRDWLTEIEADPEGHDPVRALSGLTCPVLLLHGDADDTVPAEDMQRYAAAKPDAEAHLIPDANHVFNAPNPLPADAPLPPQTAELFDNISDFIGPILGVL